MLKLYLINEVLHTYKKDNNAIVTFQVPHAVPLLVRLKALKNITTREAYTKIEHNILGLPCLYVDSTIPIFFRVQQDFTVPLYAAYNSRSCWWRLSAALDKKQRGAVDHSARPRSSSYKILAYHANTAWQLISRGRVSSK